MKVKTDVKYSNQMTSSSIFILLPFDPADSFHLPQRRAAPRRAATVRLIAGRLREQEHVSDHFHCLAPYSLSAPHTCYDVRYFRPSDWLLQQSALSLLIGLTKHTPRSLAADGRKCTCSKLLCQLSVYTC